MTLVAVALSAGACAQRTQIWSQPESPKENKVEWIVIDHPVSFKPGFGKMSKQERWHLDKFISGVSPTEGDQILIRAKEGGRSVEARAVRDYLRKRSIRAAIVQTPRLNTRSGPILVEVGRFVVTPPRCPDWTKPPDSNRSNTVNSNFGCATTTNLGLMVAQPGDLLDGRDLGPADSSYATLHEDRYRKGVAPKTTPTASSPTDFVQAE